MRPSGHPRDVEARGSRACSEVATFRRALWSMLPVDGDPLPERGGVAACPAREIAGARLRPRRMAQDANERVRCPVSLSEIDTRQ